MSNLIEKILLEANYYTNYNSDVFYSTWGEPYRFDEFIQTEVEERQNYTNQQIKQWYKKYKLLPSSECIWVTPDKYTAMSYHEDIEDKEEWLKNAKKENRPVDIYEYYKKDGFVIPETDDGENGILFVFKNTTKQ